MQQRSGPLRGILENIARDEQGDGELYVCIQGAREMDDLQSYRVCLEIGKALADVERETKKKVVLLLNGATGAQSLVVDAFLSNGGEHKIHQIFHLLTSQNDPIGTVKGFQRGKIVIAGADPFERKVETAKSTDVFLLLDPGVAALEEALISVEAGAMVIPIMTSATMPLSWTSLGFDKPKAISQEDWFLFHSAARVRPEQLAGTLAKVLLQFGGAA